MRIWTKVAAASSLALLTTAVTAAPARAVDPPPNDDISNATPVTVPFNEVRDVTGMTDDPLEDSLLGNCEHDSFGGVWYKLVGTGDKVVIDTAGSDFRPYWSGGIGLSDTGFEDYVTCDIGFLSQLDTEPGTTYYILVSDEDPEDGIGGSLHISFAAPPPPPTATFTLSRRAVVYRTGVPRLHGTYACTNGGYFSAFGDLTQRGTGVGFMLADEPGFLNETVCDGARHRWSARTNPDSDEPAPRFRPGWAKAQMAFEICGTFECVSAGIDKRVFLKPRHRR